MRTDRNDEFAILCDTLGAPGMAQDPCFRITRQRLQNIDALERDLSSLTRTFDRDQLVAQLRARNLPAGPVYNTSEVMADPAFAAANVTRNLTHKESGKRLIPGLPTHFSGFTPIYRPAPALGEHTDEVLSTVLGYSADEIARLREQGIVG